MTNSQQAKPAINSLHRNTAWMAGATATYTACQWLGVVFLARYTDAQLLGTYALALAVVTPVLALTGLQLRYILCSDAKADFAVGSYFAVRGGTVLLSLLGISMWATTQSSTILLATVVLAIGKGSDALCDIVHGFLQAHGRLDRIAMSLMLQGPLQLLFLTGGTILTNNLVFGLAGAAIVSQSIFWLFDLKNFRRVRDEAAPPASERKPTFARAHLGWPVIKKLVLLGLPMGLVMGMSSLQGNVPRYLLASSHGEAAVGIFAALYYLTLPGGILVAAYADSSFAQLARWGAEGRFRSVYKTVGFLILAAGGIGAAGWLIALIGGKTVLAVCYPREYAAHNVAFVWLMAAGAFVYIGTVLGFAVTSLREFYLQVPFRFGHLLIALLLCALWIPAEGLLGAAKAMLVSSILFAIGMALLLVMVVRKRAFAHGAAALGGPSPAPL